MCLNVLLCLKTTKEEHDMSHFLAFTNQLFFFVPFTIFSKYSEMPFYYLCHIKILFLFIK